ncbi:MAG: histidine kinase dimerization/phospho-acceptor domain-containing protein, partial [Pseudomonadota bacterium]
MKDKPPESSLAVQLRWLMFFRVITTTFLLGTTIVVQFRDIGAALNALYGLIGFIYFLTFTYALILPRLLGQVTQAYIQITGDLVITTAIIYLTGGLDSAFSFMYILYIINAGILLRIRGAVIAASLSSLFYGALLDLHYFGFIDPYLTKFSYQEHFQATDILNTVLVNMGAFYVVAFLSGYLSKQAEESRLKLAERQSVVERLEDLNESIIQSIDSGLMTLDSKGEILALNPAAERITGAWFEKVKGRPYTAVFPGLEIPDESGRGGDSPPLWTWTYRRPDGQELFLDIGLTGLRDRSGDPWGRLLVFQDRTLIHRMEEEVKRVEKLAVVGEIAAGIAHEIRNPLASISGSFQMLESELQVSEDQERLVNIIRREMDRLNRIVNEFLIFARPRSGMPAPFDLSRVVEDNLKMFQNQVGLNDKIEVNKQVSPGIWVRFDQHQLEQVMWNLLR